MYNAAPINHLFIKRRNSMPRKLSLLALLIIFSTGFMFGQAEKPKQAEQILKSALSEAKASNKNVFLIIPQLYRY